MDQTIAIKAAGLGKAYRIWQAPADRLISPILHNVARWTPANVQEKLNRRAANGYKDFAALSDINFEVNRGEAVAIIGRNGAGKSTLLQLIAGTLQPSSGNIEVNGRVAALLELGAGFNPEFTGRENVFLSGAVLGLNKTEMEQRFDEVLSFADIGEFIEQPVKTYSSGMMMRLAFAVNTCIDPEILIVDEALSVGDAPFQAKCFRRLRTLVEEGTTLLFVSHDIGTVRSICKRAVWLKNGRIEMWGDAKIVAREYEKFCWKEQGVAMSVADTPPPPTTPQTTTAVSRSAILAGTDDTPEAPLDSPPASLWTAPNLSAHESGDRYGTQTVVIRKILCTDLAGEPTVRFNFNESLVIHYLLEAKAPVDSDLVIGVRVKDLKDNFIFSAQDIVTQHHISAQAGSYLYARTTIPLPFTHGHYLLKTGIFGFNGGISRPNGHYDYGRAILWDIIEDTHTFEVAVHPAMPLVGPVHAHAPLHIQHLSAFKPPISTD